MIEWSMSRRPAGELLADPHGTDWISFDDVLGIEGREEWPLRASSTAAWPMIEVVDSLRAVSSAWTIGLDRERQLAVEDQAVLERRADERPESAVPIESAAP